MNKIYTVHFMFHAQKEDEFRRWFSETDSELSGGEKTRFQRPKWQTGWYVPYCNEYVISAQKHTHHRNSAELRKDYAVVKHRQSWGVVFAL